jgi:hypothetical protein
MQGPVRTWNVFLPRRPIALCGRVGLRRSLRQPGADAAAKGEMPHPPDTRPLAPLQEQTVPI